MNAKVDSYIARSTRWPQEITELRAVLLDCGLTEALKWGKPCYACEGGNIAIIQEMNDFLALMFFKGALLDDPAGLLEEQGANSRSARRIRFGSVAEVRQKADDVRRCVEAAVAVERAGLKVGPPPELVLVDELRDRLDADPALAAAFAALTPGRRRGYNLHVASAKRASTRAARVEQHVPRIMEGKGLHDR